MEYIMSELIPKYGTETNILLQPINEGYIYVATDTKRLYTDLNGTRLCLTDIQFFQTDSERTATLAPLSNKLYIVIETGVCWTYKDGWVTLGNSVSVDNTTLKFNENNILQVEGTLDQNSKSVKYDWIGTKEQWETGRQDSSIPDSYICYITDEEATLDFATRVATQEEALAGTDNTSVMTPLRVQQAISNRLSELNIQSISRMEYDELQQKDENTLYFITE